MTEVASSSSSSSANSGFLLSPLARPATNTRVSNARNDEAFSNPRVRETIGKLRARLREAEKKTGDINKDIHNFVTIPYFVNLKRTNNQIAELFNGGKKNTRGFMCVFNQFKRFLG